MGNIPLGKVAAIRILIADEMGLNPEFATFAKMYLDGNLAPTQFAILERAGHDANKLINDSGRAQEALELAEKYL